MLIPSGQSPGKVQFASCELAGGMFLRSVLSSQKYEETSPLCGERVTADLLKQSSPQMSLLLNPGPCPLLPQRL